ncbi:MAG TPA: PKD domain-containing protein, partial [Bryobacteraceae bacterium]
MRGFTYAAVITAALCVTNSAPAQSGSGPYVGNYQLVSEQRISRTIFDYTYKADLINPGAARSATTATVTTAASGASIVPGQNTLHFPAVAANGRVTSTDTFTIQVDRTIPFDFASLVWSFMNPVANAGPNITAAVGSTVQLNASLSTNPSGAGVLTYDWVCRTFPAGTRIALSDENAVMPTFVVPARGVYVFQLTVSNGVATDSASVTVSTINSPPVANAGRNQTVNVGATVLLDGSRSSDVDGDPLTYRWTFVSLPAGSSAILAGANSVSASFVVDKAGSYIVQLIVNDGTVDSLSSTATITTNNTPPVANAGNNQTVAVGSLVQLNGANSSDADGDPLTYHWVLITFPANTSARLSSLTVVNPTFTVDLPGTYVAQLTVNDGKIDSTPATVSITTSNIQAPTANAGPPQTVVHGSTVNLSGSGPDPQNLPLTFSWSLTTKPQGSQAQLSATNIAQPTFVADKPGPYVAQLVVNNGFVNSQPSTVTVTTTNSVPVADAGQNRNVSVGTMVALDGSKSSDADHDPLTYSWSLTRPAGSSATLQSPNSVSPTLLPDVAGTYVAQLIVSDPFTSSNPVTVSITAASMTITLTPNPLVLSSSSGTLTVNLDAPAGPSGLTVNFSGFDSSVISVPSSVNVSPNATGANVQVTRVSIGSTNISASAAGYQTGSAQVKVTGVLSFSTQAVSVGVGGVINIDLLLSAPAPASGLTISLNSATPTAATVPATVTIAANQTHVTTQITGVGPGSSLITASTTNPLVDSSNASVTATVSGGVTILAPASLTVSPGDSVPYPVSIDKTLPTSVSIDLTSVDTNTASVSPATITIQAGQTQPQTTPRITGVAAGTTSVTAKSSNPNLSQASTSVTVAYTLTLSPSSQTLTQNGLPGNVTLQLSGPAPAAGINFELSSDDPTIASVPAGIFLSGTSSSISARVLPLNPGHTKIRAKAPGIAEATADVTVQAPGSITLSAPATILLDSTGTLTVTLSRPAPPGGVTVNLSSTNPDVLTVSPGTLMIPADATVPAVQPTLSTVNTGAASIQASATGYTAATPVTVNVNATITWITTDVTIVGIGQQATVQLRLNMTAPMSPGLFVNLTSDNPNVVSIQPTGVFIWDGSNAPTIALPITSTGAGSTKLRASGTNVPEVIANVTVTAPLLISTSSLPGGTVGLAYLAQAAATGGVQPYHWSATGLPGGVNIDANTGVISGSPNAAGAFNNVVVTVTDSTAGTHLTASKTFSITISQGLSITTATPLASGTVGVAYNAQVNAAGGVSPYSWSATGLPGGLSID